MFGQNYIIFGAAMGPSGYVIGSMLDQQEIDRQRRIKYQRIEEERKKEINNLKSDINLAFTAGEIHKKAYKYELAINSFKCVINYYNKLSSKFNINNNQALLIVYQNIADCYFHLNEPIIALRNIIIAKKISNNKENEKLHESISNQIIDNITKQLDESNDLQKPSNSLEFIRCEKFINEIKSSNVMQNIKIMPDFNLDPIISRMNSAMFNGKIVKKNELLATADEYLKQANENEKFIIDGFDQKARSSYYPILNNLKNALKLYTKANSFILLSNNENEQLDNINKQINILSSKLLDLEKQDLILKLNNTIKCAKKHCNTGYENQYIAINDLKKALNILNSIKTKFNLEKEYERYYIQIQKEQQKRINIISSIKTKLNSFVENSISLSVNNYGDKFKIGKKSKDKAFNFLEQSYLKTYNVTNNIDSWDPKTKYEEVKKCANFLDDHLHKKTYACGVIKTKKLKFK